MKKQQLKYLSSTLIIVLSAILIMIYIYQVVSQ